MMYKKAQSEVITTVLIILLVLAAIVIVWQVVGSTIQKGGEQITAQTGCIGVTLETTSTSSTVFIAKRSAQGGTFETSELAVLVDGERLTSGYTVSPATNPLANPLDTATVTLDDAATSKVEIGIKGDGTTCPATGIWTA